MKHTLPLGLTLLMLAQSALAAQPLLEKSWEDMSGANSKCAVYEDSVVMTNYLGRFHGNLTLTQTRNIRVGGIAPLVEAARRGKIESHSGGPGATGITYTAYVSPSEPVLLKTVGFLQQQNLAPEASALIELLDLVCKL